MKTSSQDRRFGVIPPDELARLSGLAALQGMLDGSLPGPAIAQLLDFGAVGFSPGRAEFTGTPDARHLNPLGTVHGGYAATLLDSCMACAVQTLLEPGQGYTSMEFKISFVRPLTTKTGQVRAIGTALSRGRRAAFAEGRLVDAADRLIAHGTTTCLIFPLDEMGMTGG